MIKVLIFSEEIAQKCSVKKGILRNFSKFTGKHQCNLIKKETVAQMFSCEFCEISKNTFSYKTPPVAASEACQNVIDHRGTITLFDYYNIVRFKITGSGLLMNCFRPNIVQKLK